MGSHMEGDKHRFDNVPFSVESTEAERIATESPFAATLSELTVTMTTGTFAFDPANCELRSCRWCYCGKLLDGLLDVAMSRERFYKQACYACLDDAERRRLRVIVHLETSSSSLLAHYLRSID